MFIYNFDPVAIEFFSLEIRWYSAAYIAGILIGWILSKKIFISNLQIKEKFDDFITYLILGVIVGGRLGYVIFFPKGDKPLEEQCSDILQKILIEIKPYD